jgi:hypothetical protein
VRRRTKRENAFGNRGFPQRRAQTRAGGTGASACTAPATTGSGDGGCGGCGTSDSGGVAIDGGLGDGDSGSIDDDGGSGGSDSGGTDIDGSSPDTCDQCAQTACGSQEQTCENDPACLQLWQCENGCGSQSCIDGCANGSTQGALSELDAVSGCTDQSCATECGASDGGQDACGFSFNSASCAQCFESSCCSQGQACASDPDCLSLDSCLNACAQGDQACENTCFSQAPAPAQTEEDDLNSCINGLPASCGC